VGEVIPVLPGRSILYRLHRRGRSGGDRELRQVHVEAGRSRPSIPGYSCRTREACRWASGLGGENAKDGDRASLARRPVNPSVELSAFRWAAPSLPRVLQARRALERWGVAVRSDRVVKRPEDSPSWADWDPSPQRPQAPRNCYDSRTEVRLRQLRQSWELRRSEAAFAGSIYSLRCRRRFRRRTCAGACFLASWIIGPSTSGTRFAWA
jgi:hypothetical protein